MTGLHAPAAPIEVIDIPTTRDRHHAGAETELRLAMQEYKESSGRMFPTWSEVLEVLKSLGYAKQPA